MSLNVIAITQRLINNDSYPELREALSLEWGTFFLKNLPNCIPLPVSYSIPFSRYTYYLSSNLKGVILSGGNDLNFINPNPLSSLRDQYELNLIDACIAQNIPLLGICRGSQIIASRFKAKIIKVEKHVGNHEIFDKQGNSYIVNSFHNYAIKDLDDDFEIIAKAFDNTIEAFAHRKYPLIGIVFHIERNNSESFTEPFLMWEKMVKGL